MKRLIILALLFSCLASYGGDKPKNPIPKKNPMTAQAAVEAYNRKAKEAGRLNRLAWEVKQPWYVAPMTPKPCKCSCECAK